MKLVRLLLLGAAALAVLLGLAMLAAFNSGVQTWAARRSLAARPALGVTLDSVSAGLDRVEIKNLRLASHGAVLTVPLLQAGLPLISAGLKHQVTVTRLVANGWTLDLTKLVRVGQVFDPTSPPAPHRVLAQSGFSLLSSVAAAESSLPAATEQAFRGIFAQLALPVDLALDGVDLEGEVILPAARGHVRLTLTGGGLGTGRDGRFELAASSALTSTAVSTLETHCVFTVTMDTPRTFTRLGVKADATASGSKFPRGVRLSGDATAARGAAGEEYALTLTTADKQLVAVQASFPLTARKLTGTWKIDLGEPDVAPFALGRALPPFVADGEGQFDFDAAFAEVHARGKLNAASGNLAALRAELGALGALRLAAEFDLTQIGDQTRVDRLSAVVTGAQPVVTVGSLQTLTYNRATHGLQAADPARDLFAVTLQGVPLAWAQPFVKGIALAGGDLRGEFVATTSDGGFSLRPKSPLTATGVSVVQAGKPLLRAVDLSLNASVDYTPHGWQATVAPLILRSGSATLLTLEAKAGQLAGADQVAKAAGKFSASLPAVLAQPAAGGAMQLTRGDAAGEFAASLGPTREIQAKIVLTNLEADPKLTAEKLPAISADVRADLAAGGQITFSAPLLVERNGRKSDLTLVGTLAPDAKGLTVAARVSSTKLVLDDVKILAAPLAAAPSPTPAADPATVIPAGQPDAAPPWAGLHGQIALALQEVVYSSTFQATEVTGTLRLDAGAMKFDGLHAGLGKGSDAKISGAVTFDPKAVAPYALNADLAVTDFDPAPLFQALNPGQPATVEGRFNVTSKLTGQAARLKDFATTTRGDFQLTSKGGLYRGLPVAVANAAEKSGRFASFIATGSSVMGALTGKKEYADIASKAQAVAEIARLFSPIQYDQLNIVLTRDESLNTVIKEFTLIAPEMRLAGQGRTTHRANVPLLDEAVAMEFKLRARGHTGDLFKYLGALEAQADELGYLACSLPLKIGGTLGKPDTSELNRALADLALEKSGTSDKASDLFNKLFGK